MPHEDAPITSDLRSRLTIAIDDFLQWLTERVDTRASRKYSSVGLRDTQEDWIMKVEDEDGSEVLFNTSITDRCTYDYFEMVVLHECYHLLVQDLPNKVDAKRLKDDFGDIMMKLLDIEADYYTFMYYRSKGRSLVHTYSLNYQGSSLFGDPRIRISKLERFFGSLLSISNVYFLQGTEDNFHSGPPTLFLPCITNLPLEETMNVIVLRGGNFYLKPIPFTVYNLINLKHCYTRAYHMSAAQYVRSALGFASLALSVPLPPKIDAEIASLEEVY